MPSSFSKQLSGKFRRSSVSSTKTQFSSVSSGFDRMGTFSSVAGVLGDVEFPNTNSPPKIEVIQENEVLDLDFEDHAWGPPPTIFTIPAFLRRKQK